MTKNEQNRVLAWRLKLLHEASVMPRNVAQACRHFGLSRKTFINGRLGTRHTAKPDYAIVPVYQSIPRERRRARLFRRFFIFASATILGPPGSPLTCCAFTNWPLHARPYTAFCSVTD